jgi:large subunit ribosomal protein L7A
MERIKQNPHVVGLKQSKKAIESGKAELVFIARDADSHVVFPLERLCGEKNVEVIYVNNMKELAKACHVEVPTAVATILGKNA